VETQRQRRAVEDDAARAGIDETARHVGRRLDRVSISRNGHMLPIGHAVIEMCARSFHADRGRGQSTSMSRDLQLKRAASSP
jgi:hypothetical protein